MLRREEPDPGLGPHATRLAVKARTSRHHDDYKRNGTATLFAALNIFDGQVIGMCQDCHRHQEWLRFPAHAGRCDAGGKATAPHPGQLCHAQASQNTALAKTAPALSCSLYAHQRLVVEHDRAVLPGPDREPAATRGIQGCDGLSPRDLQLCGSAQPQPKPFIWTASAKDILEKVKRARKALINVQSV